MDKEVKESTDPRRNSTSVRRRRNRDHPIPEGTNIAHVETAPFTRSTPPLDAPGDSPPILKTEHQFLAQLQTNWYRTAVMSNTWAEDIAEALRNLGGEATLEEIYHEASVIRDAPLPDTVDQTIRDAIQRHSSDSQKFQGGSDYFYSVPDERGVWGLRDRHR